MAWDYRFGGKLALVVQVRDIADENQGSVRDFDMILVGDIRWSWLRAIGG